MTTTVKRLLVLGRDAGGTMPQRFIVFDGGRS
jgi:hypothetical protein